MTPDEYLKERLEYSLKWYSAKSSSNKNIYQFLKAAEIMFSVTIPFLTGYLNEVESLKYLIGVLALLVAIIAGMLVVFKFHEKWMEYRATAENLKREKFMFLTKAGPYKTDSSLSALSERVESFISKENTTWNQFMADKERTAKKKESLSFS